MDGQVWWPTDQPPFDWAMSLMPNLRATDPELRDTLTYEILTQLLMIRALTPNELAKLLDLATSQDYLFYRIGETNTDSVFARSFAALVVAAVVEVDSTDAHLSAIQIKQAMDTVIAYARAERDYRGFVDGKGWAHSVAHAADALDSLAQHPRASSKQHTAILDTVAQLAGLGFPLVYGEDDRLAFVVLRLAQRGPSEIDWPKWLTAFRVASSGSVSDDLRAGNIGHFLRALHLMLHWELPRWPHTNVLLNQMREVHKFYRYGTLPLK